MIILKSQIFAVCKNFCKKGNENFNRNFTDELIDEICYKNKNKN